MQQGGMNNDVSIHGPHRQVDFAWNIESSCVGHCLCLRCLVHFSQPCLALCPGHCSIPRPELHTTGTESLHTPGTTHQKRLQYAFSRDYKTNIVSLHKAFAGLDCLISKFFDLPFAKALRHQRCISNLGKYPHFSPRSDIFADPQVPLPTLMYQKGFKNLKLQLHQIMF